MTQLLTDLITAVHTYGYVALWCIVFLASAGIPLPTDPLFLAIGAFTAEGSLSVLAVVVVALTAAVCGDSAGYLVGRHWGAKALAWLESSPAVARVIPARSLKQARAKFGKHGGLAVFISRSFLGEFSGVINLLAGSLPMPFRVFLIYDVVGEAADVVGMLAIGWIAGESWEAANNTVHRVSLVLLGCLVLALLLTVARRFIHHRKQTANTGVK